MVKINQNNLKTVIHLVFTEGTTVIMDVFQKEVYGKRKKKIPSKSVHVVSLLYKFIGMIGRPLQETQIFTSVAHLKCRCCLLLLLLTYKCSLY